MTKIHAISGLAGSGKTTVMLERIVSSEHNKHLIAVPSIELSKELQKHLTQRGVDVLVINSETHPNTTACITQHLTNVDDVKKHVLIITHLSFRLMDITNTDGWVVWHDELPVLFQNQKVWFDSNIPFNDYFVVDGNNRVSLTPLALANTNHDSLNPEMKGLIHGIKSGRYTAYLVSSFSEYGRNYNIVTTILTPEYFPNNTTLLSAGIEDSLVYKMLTKANACDRLEVMPTNITNHYSDKIEIVYAIDNNNSRYLRETYPDEFKAAVDALCGLVRGDCIAVANADISIPSRFKRLTHNVHGCNEYINYNSVMFLSALNIDPFTQAVVTEVLDVDSFDMYLDRTVAIAYQVAMRGSIRLEKEIESYKIFVMDYQLAHSLKHIYFPNATVTGLEGYSVKLKPRGRPRGTVPPLDALTRKRIHRIRAKARAGLYDDITNYRILNSDARSIMKMSIWSTL